MTKFLSSIGDPNVRLRGIFAPPPSDHVDARVLAAGEMTRHALPAGMAYVVFDADRAFFVRFGDGAVEATVTDADVVDGSASLPNLGAVEIPAGATHVALVAAEACTVHLMFYERA